MLMRYSSARNSLRATIARCNTTIGTTTTTPCGSVKVTTSPISSSFPSCGFEAIRTQLQQSTSSQHHTLQQSHRWINEWQHSFERCALSKLHGAEELKEFTTNQKSNGRSLEWRVIEIAPHTAFPPHTHVALEFYYIGAGTLYETRMRGSPRSREFPSVEEVEAGTKVCMPPDLSGLGPSQFRENRLSAGDWNYNEIGSVHQTFTREEHCMLLVLGCGHIVPVEELLGNGKQVFRPTTVSRSRQQY